MLQSHAVNLTKNYLRPVSSAARTAFTQASIVEPAPNEIVNEKWLQAKPFQQLPGPTKLNSVVGFLPGGRYHGKSLLEMNAQMRQEYGEIFLLPGLFGKRDLLFTFNPDDFQTIYRTEGPYPLRRGFDIIEHYRKHIRQDVYIHAGLLPEQGESWGQVRSTVNPVMMNPKTVVLYAPKIDKVVNDFISHIRDIRDPQTNEVPANFESDINNWAFENVGLVAFDTELGMIKNSSTNPEAKRFIEGVKEFFELLFILDFQPSLWKYIPTPQYKKCVKMMDDITALTVSYINKATLRLEERKKNGLPPKPEHEQSVLERLVVIDQAVANVMSADLLLAGIDTTTSAMVSCLLSLAKNPEKQAKLREEIMQTLPHKADEMTSAKLKHLPYLRACIKESFRVHPISTGNFRATGQDVVLSGYRIPKHTDVTMPAQLLLQDEKYYARPTEYLPERWLRASETEGCPVNNKNPFVLLPFGFGPRNCIGKRIVDLEMEVTLAKLVRNFQIAYDYPTDNFFRTNILNVPNKPLKFKFIDLKN